MGDRIRQFLEDYGEEVIPADDPETVEKISAQNPPASFDWLVSSGFYWVVSNRILALGRETCNVHPSLLPWGRGVNPNVWAIIDHEPAGVSIHQMVSEVDAGPVYVQRAVTTSFQDTGRDLYERLEDAAVRLFVEAWPQLRVGDVEPSPQTGHGSEHRRRDFEVLCDISLQDQVTWRRAIDVLRALTFPPHRNVTFDVEGRTYHVEIRLEDVTDEMSGRSPAEH